MRGRGLDSPALGWRGWPPRMPRAAASGADRVRGGRRRDRDGRRPKAEVDAGGAARLDNIRANPAVSVLVDRYDEDWTQLWWARADGDARLIDATDPCAAEALAALVGRYEQYRLAPPPGPVIQITVRRWSGWTASGERLVRHLRRKCRAAGPS